MNTRMSIDGVIKGPGSLHPRHVARIKPTMPTKARTVAPHHPKHKPQHSDTLHRSAVKQPLFFRGLKNKAEQIGVAPPTNELITRRADKARLARAEKVERSNLIARFDSHTRPKLIKKVAHLPVAKPRLGSQIPKLVPPAHQVTQQIKPDPLQAALESAASHEAKQIKVPSQRSLFKKLGVDKKSVRVSFGALIAVLAVGFLAYQNIPHIKMRLASSRASINGSLPNYKPSGYTLGAISPEPGQVTLDYKSNTDARSYKLTQKKSGWNSEALLNNYVSTTKKPYQTYQEQGKTIYIYGQSNATWVDGGIWYKIEGDAQLTSEQLIRIARSL